jgi:transcriptional regulator with XRE-family HTH domain
MKKGDASDGQLRKFVRRRTGMSQRDLARKARIPRNKIIEWEAGRAELSPEEYSRWEQTVCDPKIKEDLSEQWAMLNYVSGFSPARLREIEKWAEQKFGPDKKRAEWLESFKIPARKFAKLIGESNA